MPFVCVSKSKDNSITKKQLIDIVNSYIQYNGFEEEFHGYKSNSKNSITTSTPKKRKSSVSTPLNSPPPVKRFELSFSEQDNTSYFDGLLDTPSTKKQASPQLISQVPLSQPPSIRKLSSSMKRKCIKELLANGQLTDIAINAFCVRTHSLTFI